MIAQSSSPNSLNCSTSPGMPLPKKNQAESDTLRPEPSQVQAPSLAWSDAPTQYARFTSVDPDPEKKSKAAKK